MIKEVGELKQPVAGLALPVLSHFTLLRAVFMLAVEEQCLSIY